MTTIAENRYETIDATAAVEDWVIETNVTVSVSGLGFDASDDVAGRNFIIKGSLLTGNQPAIILGATASFDIETTIKVDIAGIMRSGAAGLVAKSGGVTFLNVGQVEAAQVVLDFLGDANSIENDAALTSTGSIAIRSAGLGDKIVNNGTITGYADAIVSAGDDTIITNNLNLTSQQGRGVVSSGATVAITNTGPIKARLDAIVSSGIDATINNYDTLTSKAGAGIVSSGDGATIVTSTYIDAETFGILSTGDNADITNSATVESSGIGIKSTGDHSSIYTSLTLIGKTALFVSGDDTEITTVNNVYGTSKSAAAIRITSLEGTTLNNEGSIFAKSGHAIAAADGNDSITNTGSIHGDVKLGAGGDFFSSLSGSIDGKVYGGMGNDVYQTGIELRIVEKANQGYDTVRSEFSWTLGANLENLELTGTSDAFAKGNTLDNQITGNAGDNTLTGGAGRDAFIFAAGGMDTITDFQNHKDHVDFSNLPGVERFADISDHMTQVGKDVLIDLTDLEADLYLTIQHITLARLTAADFLF